MVAVTAMLVTTGEDIGAALATVTVLIAAALDIVITRPAILMLLVIPTTTTAMDMILTIMLRNPALCNA